MSQTTVKVQIQQRYDTAANWTSAGTTVLLSGEIGWESDTKKYKIGDGSTAWSSLSYAPGAGGYTAGTGVTISASNVISASAVALSQVFTAANQTAHLALTTQEGDIVVRSDENKSYVRNSGSASDMTDYTLLATPTDAVLSINGQTGAITADQLATAIESATDSNTFTDADHAKLNGIAASANNYAISADLLDEDDFATNSDAKVPSQQSTKAYVDTADALKANLSGATFTGDVIFTGDAANVTWDKSDNALEFADNAKATFGTGSDFLIWHQSADNRTYLWEKGAGALCIQGSYVKIQSPQTDPTDASEAEEDLAVFKSDGAVELYWGGTSPGKKFETTSTGVLSALHIQSGPNGSFYCGNASGVLSGEFANWDSSKKAIKIGADPANDAADSYISLQVDGAEQFQIDNGALTGADNKKIKLGGSAELQFFFDGSNSYITNATSNLILSNSNTDAKSISLYGDSGLTENLAHFIQGGAAQLFYDGGTTPKFETTANGVNINDYELKISAPSGSSAQFLMYGDGSSANNDLIRMDGGNGRWDLYCYAGSGSWNNLITAHDGGPVEIFHADVKKLETTLGGIQVNGKSGSDPTLNLLSGDLAVVSEAIRFSRTDSSGIRYHSLMQKNGGAGDNYLEFKLHTGGSGGTPANTEQVSVLKLSETGAIIRGKAGGDGELHLYADAGSANADLWRLKAESGAAEFDIQNFAGGSWENNIRCNANNSVQLYYDGGSPKFETESGGAKVTGKLEVAGDTAGGNTLTVAGVYSSGASVDIQTWERTGGAVQAKLIYKDASTSMSFGTDTAHNLEIMTGGTTALTLDSSQNATFAGTVTCTSVTETSDIALKSNIQPLTNVLDKINQITGYKYDFTSTNSSSMGVIAQDVEKVFPELVHGQEGSKTLQYSGLIGALVESVKELSAKVAALEAG